MNYPTFLRSVRYGFLLSAVILVTRPIRFDARTQWFAPNVLEPLRNMPSSTVLIEFETSVVVSVLIFQYFAVLRSVHNLRRRKTRSNTIACAQYGLQISLVRKWSISAHTTLESSTFNENKTLAAVGVQKSIHVIQYEKHS